MHSATDNTSERLTPVEQVLISMNDMLERGLEYNSWAGLSNRTGLAFEDLRVVISYLRRIGALDMVIRERGFPNQHSEMGFFYLMWR
jgi:hypothetical protein